VMAGKPKESHYSRILVDMRQQILGGHWKPGLQLSKETELADRHGVSRMTMNKVLTQLTREGLLVRRKRSGTFVAQQRGQSAVMEITDIEQEVTQLGLPYRWKLLSLQKRSLTAVELSALAMPAGKEGESILFLKGLHLAREVPFCFEMRAIHLAAVPQAAAQDFGVLVPGQWLLRTMPFSAASHRVRAINATGKEAKVLDIAAGAACLEILRRTLIGKDWVTYVRLLYPGEIHQLVADFAPRPGST
jgi:GntR family histidine utilization transcriptional repressor